MLHCSLISWGASVFLQARRVAVLALMGPVLLTLMSSCVAHKPYRLQQGEKPARRWTEWDWNRSADYFEPQPTKIQVDAKTPEPRFAVVELDDHGEFWSRRQHEEALNMLRTSPKPPLTILYVHGWKHNASERSGDFQSFRRLLATLATRPAMTANWTICGIYVGWRGDLVGKWADHTVVGFLPRQATIYNRMEAADRIANGLPFTQFLSQVSQLSLQRKTGPGPNQKGRCVMIGHSLGGRILETSISRTLSTITGPDAVITKPADLVVLVNPASDGLRARQTLLAVQWAPLSAYPKVQPDGTPGEHYPVPLVVYMRSESDSATSWIYKGAMVLWKGLNRRTRTYPTKSLERDGREIQVRDHSQFDYITHTAPTLAHLRSHRVEELRDDEGATTAKLSDVPGFTALDYNASNAVAVNRFPITHADGSIHWYGIKPDTDGDFKMYEPTPEKRRGSCWIMQVPKPILKGHGGTQETNGIFSNSMVDFITALYRITLPASNQGSVLRPAAGPGLPPTRGPAPAATPSLASPEVQMQPMRDVKNVPEEKLPPAPSVKESSSRRSSSSTSSSSSRLLKNRKA